MSMFTMSNPVEAAIAVARSARAASRFSDPVRTWAELARACSCSPWRRLRSALSSRSRTIVRAGIADSMKRRAETRALCAPDQRSTHISDGLSLVGTANAKNPRSSSL